ncbi:unnamed protein product [Adineta steineri]|uniref:glycogenin glucosyltransferase n=1 Tax=Adineta steineri TaxID=433720 RepID=A0A814WIP7_9BILA|nr:unnamed protein product [Adineta steineri]CAF1202083.1 unnamed protein product [Adineta steineri]
MSSEAFVTLATNDGYALGALVVAQSLRKVGTQRQLVVMISRNISNIIRQTLETSFDEIVVVEELNSHDEEHLRLLSRPELGVTFTKINCWLLEKYSKCVFLDADVVVLQNIDDLFEREEISAAPDAGWPDCFNSGVFVYKPSKETFTKLLQFANQQDASFDGGDQGLLNAFFSNWRSADISRHLPFTYNVTSNTFYSYVPAVTQFRNDIRVVHFAGALKPWQLTYNPQNEQLSGNLGGQQTIQREFLLAWWKIMYERVWPQLSKHNQSNISVMTKSPSIKLNFNKEKSFIYKNRSLSYPSIIDDLFNDISIRENLKRKYSADKILPKSGIFHLKQGQIKPFYKIQPKSIPNDSFSSLNQQQHKLPSEKILSLFSKKTNSMNQLHGGFTGSLLNYGSLTNEQGVQAGSAAHRRAWESGHVDYHGRDSFTNIQEQLQKNLGQQQQPYHPSQQRQVTPPKSTPASANTTQQQQQPTGETTSSNTGASGVLKTTTTTTVETQEKK